MLISPFHIYTGVIITIYRLISQKMPPKFGGGDICDVCSKTVYAAERVEAGQRPYHKLCFKCSVCKMQLKIESYAQAHGVLYCKKHYQENIVAKNTQDPAAAMQ